MANEDLKRRFFLAAHGLRKVKMQKFFHDIPQGEVIAMRHIAQVMESNPEGVTVTELARRLKITSPTTSRFLRNLERKGWIIRKMNTADRRNIHVELTPEGQNVHQEMTRLMSEFMETIVNRLGSEKTEVFISLVNEMTEIMEDELEKLERSST